MNPDVFLVKTEPRYPEFPYESRGDGLHGALRALFSLWGKNPDNPFAGSVGPGGRVVIKPNWVRDYNPNGHDLDSLITHSSLIKHVLDFVAVALDGRGSVVIGDAPLQSCNFQRLIERSRVAEVVRLAQQRHPGIEFLVEDWRLTLLDRFDGFSEWDTPASQTLRAGYGETVSEHYQLVDVGRDSFLEDIAEYASRFRVACYKPSLMAAHHRPGKHEYLVTKRVFGADLLINLPKMKTHIKAGLTGALKNLVGINGHKEYLPHHIKGSYFDGGDDYCAPSRLRSWHDDLYDRVWEHYMEMPAARRRVSLRLLHWLWRLSHAMSGDYIDAGSWSGNETIWRTTLDLNHILYFNAASPRHIVTIVDGVIAGECDGPLTPTPKPAGLLVGGENPAYVDAVLARLMGYNLSRVPTVYHAIYHRKSRFAGPDPSELRVTGALDSGKPETVPLDHLPNLGFVKPRYWRRAAVEPPASA